MPAQQETSMATSLFGFDPLARNQPLPEATLHRLEQASHEIEAIKKDVRLSALQEADKALDRLEREQPAQYAKLLRERTGNRQP